MTRLLLISIFTVAAAADTSIHLPADAGALDIEYQHGRSYVTPLKYGPDFPHFDYVNPNAPKGGGVRVPEMGTFDSFNNILEKGRIAAGVDFLGARNLIYDRLMEFSIDEPASMYGRLAEGIAVGPDYRWVAFKLREGAYWHDGEPLTVDDVIFTFNMFKEHGSVALKTALLDLDHVRQVGPREVLLVTKEGALINPVLPFAYGGMPILPKHYWSTRDISKTTVKPPLGSGPYRIKDVDFGRAVIYQRVDDYWGENIPVNRGRYNYDTMKFDYFRDENVMLEAHKADVIDVRHETVSKAWATEYGFPAVEAGLFKKELLYITRPWGLWWPVFWNLGRERFQDARVREALWLLYDFRWINRVILFGFYQYGHSFFHNSDMAQRGLPSVRELELLEPWREKLPKRLFTEQFTAPFTEGYGHNRDNTRRALELFEQAGWVARGGKLVNANTGERFKIDFVFVSRMLLRAQMPYISALNRIGIETTAKSPENSHWLYRMRTGSFDGGAYLYIPNNTPGLDLRNRFGSASAGKKYSQNWAQIKNPVVDDLIEKVITAAGEQEFFAATRALDRVMLWNFYFIPSMAQPGYRLVYWDKYGQPDHGPLQRAAWMDTWWWDRDKAEVVADGIAALE